MFVKLYQWTREMALLLEALKLPLEMPHNILILLRLQCSNADCMSDVDFSQDTLLSAQDIAHLRISLTQFG